MGTFIVERIVRAHLATMARLNIAYDLLTYEGDILRLQFWAHAFELLKAQGAVFLQTEGKLAGCWVMPIEEDARRPRPSDEEGDVEEKVIVRSNGVVTYVGKDLANQFWKLGLLGRDFRYRRFAVQAERPRCCGRRRRPTASRTRRRSARPRGSTTSSTRGRCILQALLSQALRTLGHAERSRELRSISPTRWWRCRTPPRASSATPSRRQRRGDSKPFVEVSGRKGLGVKIDDLLDLLTNKAIGRSREAQSGLLAGRMPDGGRRRLRSPRFATSC